METLQTIREGEEEEKQKGGGTVKRDDGLTGRSGVIAAGCKGNSKGPSLSF